MPLFVTLFWGLSPAVMSGVVFIRMYEMLTTFVLLCSIMHLRAVKKNDVKLPVIRCLVPMAMVTYLGFLTQYYYFIFLFYLAVAFCAWLLWRDRKIRNCLRYGISQGAAFVLAYLTYPSCLSQMFRGQRGAQATENFFNWSNTVERVGFFCDLMNRYLFGHSLSIFLLLILVLLAVDYLWNKSAAKGQAGHTDGVVYERYGAEPHIGFWMLAFVAVGYFLTVSKTALLLGDTSNRYQLPIYGIAVLLVFGTIGILWRKTTAAYTEDGKYAKYEKYMKYAEAATVFLCLAAILLGHWKDGVVFLYPEDREQIAFAKECAERGTPAVYLYQPGEEWCIWNVTDELLEYPKVYFAAADSENWLDDIEIQSADSLVVYIAAGVDETEQAMRIAAGVKSKSGTRKFDEKYCVVWYYE